MSRNPSWSTADTRRYIRTRYGVHSYEDTLQALVRVADGEASQADYDRLVATIRVVFGVEGSFPPPSEYDVDLRELG